MFKKINRHVPFYMLLISWVLAQPLQNRWKQSLQNDTRALGCLVRAFLTYINKTQTMVSFLSVWCLEEPDAKCVENFNIVLTFFLWRIVCPNHQMHCGVFAQLKLAFPERGRIVQKVAHVE